MGRTLTLAIALGVLGFSGGAYANATGLIGSPQIKDHSIALVDLSPSAIRALRGKIGPQGPPGTFDPAKIVAVRSAYTFIGQGQEGTARVSCPPGSVLTGGGGYSPDIAPLITSGAVFPDRDSLTLNRPTEWYAGAVNHGNFVSALQAVAICAAL